MTKKILEVNNVTKTYGTNDNDQYQALKDISFSMEQGEFVGIMGASGSGKTTLLNILATLDQPTSGDVIVEGKDVTNLNAKQMAEFRSKRLGFIFQDFNLLETLTVKENIGLTLALQNQKPRSMETAIQKVSEQLNINDILDKYPNQISGGQKQRVSSARALVSNPSLILGDEPTGALDSQNARELLNTLTEINERKVSILLVTHDPFSASFCKRILFIKDGRIEEEIKADGRDRKEFYQEILEKLGTFEQ